MDNEALNSLSLTDLRKVCKDMGLTIGARNKAELQLFLQEETVHKTSDLCVQGKFLDGIHPTSRQKFQVRDIPCGFERPYIVRYKIHGRLYCYKDDVYNPQHIKSQGKKTSAPSATTNVASKQQKPPKQKTSKAGAVKQGDDYQQAQEPEISKPGGSASKRKAEENERAETKRQKGGSNSTGNSSSSCSSSSSSSSSSSASSERSPKKIALCMGNNNYERQLLANAVKDAQDFGQYLGSLGYNTKTHTDIGGDEMHRVVKELEGNMQDGNQIVLYYAGHAKSNHVGQHVLCGTDNREYNLQELLDTACRRKSAFTLIVILDACRVVPRTRGETDLDERMQDMNLNFREPEPEGDASIMLICACAHGKTSSDGNGTNGLFTETLLGVLRNNQHPERSLEDLMYKVKGALSRKQRVWMHDSTLGPTVL